MTPRSIYISNNYLITRCRYFSKSTISKTYFQNLHILIKSYFIISKNQYNFV